MRIRIKETSEMPTPLASQQAKQARNLAFVTSIMLKIAIFQRSISPEIFELHPKYFTGLQLMNIAIQ